VIRNEQAESSDSWRNRPTPAPCTPCLSSCTRSELPHVSNYQRLDAGQWWAYRPTKKMYVVMWFIS